MDETLEMEERLRESACIGDLDNVKRFVESNGVNVNSKNSINGWTALHWAAKRNHVAVVRYLLSCGADKNIKNKENDIPGQLTSNSDILALLDCQDKDFKKTELPITPGYLANPPFPYITDQNQRMMEYQQSLPMVNRLSAAPLDECELVLKARVANSDEKDFIEIEMDRKNLKFDVLLNLMCRELGVERKLVYKIRKMPNTIVRKDKDVKRLCDFQELELVLTNKAVSASSRVYGISDGMKTEHILY
ncbi:hypothetical protein ACJMK2_034161 [Sinanodonta woodiana]|uniref:Ankyrin repeat domain-containing protein 40 n=1 Tax=Sinanodonta woodiana TaxID=1069815 RepID=A0ABD3WRA1_SINWO